MKIIDLESWPRKSHYDFFRYQEMPHFALTAEVDITDMLTTIKASDSSVFVATIFCLMRAANAVPELRMRFRDNVVVEHEIIHTGVTVPIAGDRFGFCNIEYDADWKTFEANATEAIDTATRQTQLKDEGSLSRDDQIHMTCLPWITASSMQFSINGTNDCVPRVGWSKFVEREGRVFQPVHTHAHHALVDGLHVGRFFENLEGLLADVPATFSL